MAEVNSNPSPQVVQVQVGVVVGGYEGVRKVGMAEEVGNLEAAAAAFGCYNNEIIKVEIDNSNCNNAPISGNTETDRLKIRTEASLKRPRTPHRLLTFFSGLLLLHSHLVIQPPPPQSYFPIYRSQ